VAGENPVRLIELLFVFFNNLFILLFDRIDLHYFQHRSSRAHGRVAGNVYPQIA
jgi:hypothetical protein